MRRASLDRPMRVYFAGKVNGQYEPDFWRRDWFGIHQEDNGSADEHVFGVANQFMAVYAGPRLYGNGDTKGHMDSVVHEAAIHEKPHNIEMAVYDQCIEEIRECDLVVARLSEGAYGAMFEVGYAEAISKRVIPLIESRDMWFASPGMGWCGETFADDKRNFIEHVKSILSEHWFFHRWKTDKCESPIETLVCEAMHTSGHWQLDWKMLAPQHCECGFRMDLAIPRHKLAFEFDGFTYHSDRSTFNRDRERDRKLADHGWTVTRFHGDEIRQDAKAVANQIRLKAMDREVVGPKL